MFYKHKQMGDGHLNKCIECTKNDARDSRNNNLEYWREYDRKRGSRQSKNYCPEWRAEYPNKYKAQTMVGNAIRDKRLFRQACEICGSKLRIHAHHDDYLKPLNVRWLCAAHHRQWHIKNGEAKNGK